MALGKDRPLWRFKWHIVAIYVALIVVALLAVFTDIFQTSKEGQIPQLVWLLAVVILLIAVIAIVSKAMKIVDAVRENGARLEQIAELLEKNRSAVSQISQIAHLSESARAIVFLEADREGLREAVFDKLQQQDFDSTEKIIDEIAQHPKYKELAKQLRSEANNYRNATDAERINQVIAHIEKLLESHEWAKASVQIERLIKANPDSERTRLLRQRLLDKKEERKKILLTAWDDAIRRQATDRSLEILRELDMYLTPNEGLALQEAARDVFKTKLHNLGVEFSLAVSEKRWAKALQTGQLIVRGFPNSRMAQEIRETWDVLEKKVEQQVN